MFYGVVHAMRTSLSWFIYSLILYSLNMVIYFTKYYRHTTKQNSYFCAICGYPNLRRIPVTLHDDGQLEFHFSRKFKKNLRGTKVCVDF